ncbi:MAG: F0F1 ATP synthase subunit gamma [Proteobacteria bacterium]|nr:F0F1 ATP synthase subunit gamma [Pseudomonadota bacterium]
MAERMADLTAQIESVHQLDAVVTAMRGIAASRAQKGRSLLPGIEAYTDVVSRAIGHALNLQPVEPIAAPRDGHRRRGIILFCAEQGFVGAFNERVVGGVADELADATVFLLGTRGAAYARERGITPAWTAPMATNAEAVPDLANRLAEAVYGRIAGDGLARVDIVHSRLGEEGQIGVDRHSLLPIDFGRFRRPSEGRVPLTNLPPPILLERLAAEYIYAQLCQAAMHAFEAENQARMIAMAAARTNIEEKLGDLTQRERRLRQESITAEIVELATGTEAMATRKN